MRVGLIDIEPKIFNTAYMQIARYHKDKGDTVEWWTPLEHRRFGVVYCSSLFDFTDKSEIPDDVICGGTGFNVASRLSRVIEDCELDYSIYPKCRKSFLWFSRGCPRNCPWCVVPEKEGQIHSVRLKNLNPQGEHIVVLDNNFFSNIGWNLAIKCLVDFGQPVDFQGIDVRIITHCQAHSLTTIPTYKQIKIAWDNPKETKLVIDGILRLTSYVKCYKIMCYVLIGYNSSVEEDLRRVETLRELNIDPFVMPYNKKDLYQRSFARWVNHKAVFAKVSWENYKARVMAQETAGTGWTT